jgi:hypothetical protein
MGSAKSRHFVVNVQFDAAGEHATEKLRPEDYDFMITKILELILGHLGETPNAALH